MRRSCTNTNAFVVLLLACFGHRTSAFTSPSFRGNVAIVRPTQSPHQLVGHCGGSSRLSLATKTAPSDTKIATQDGIIDAEIPDEMMFTATGEAVVCARGICVLADEEVATEELCYLDEDEEGNLVGMTCVESETAMEDINPFSFEYLWPRALLLGCSLLYGTNFPLGRIMNDALPASATTSARMLLAFGVLLPFLFQLKPSLRTPEAVIGGSFCALGYLSQSVALVDTSAATVAFLGALVVIITPLVSYFADNAKLGWKDAPQTWLAAILCLVGVAALELGGEGGMGNVGMGDFWAAMQAVGFGVGFFFTEKLMAKVRTLMLYYSFIVDFILYSAMHRTSTGAIIKWCIVDDWIVGIDHSQHESKYIQYSRYNHKQIHLNNIPNVSYYSFFQEPDQALSLTAVQVGMTAFWGSIWALLDGTGVLGGFGGDQGAWLMDEVTRTQYAVPGVFLSGFGEDEVLRTVALAAAWTGIVTTAINRVGETTGLGKVSSSEASVLLATEPLWAAVFAGLFLGESMGPNAIIGGALIVAACLTTSLKPQTIQNFFGDESSSSSLAEDGSPKGPVQSVNSAGLSVRYQSSSSQSSPRTASSTALGSKTP